MSLLHDENDRLSTARAGFWLWLLFSIAIIAIDVLSSTIEVANHVYSALVAIMLALAGWAAGPRMAQHFAARKLQAPPGLPPGIVALQNQIAELRTDDERGEHTQREPVQWP